MSEPSLYDTLGVASTATESEIRAAYYALAKSAHPDRNSEDPHATEKFKAIAAAYETLKSPDSRAQYDAFGRVGSNSPLADPASRFKVYSIAVAVYLALILFDWATGYSLEGLLSIGILGTAIYFAGRKPGRLEGSALGVFLALWLLSPNFIIQICRFLSRYTAVIALLACGNALIMDIDVTSVLLFLATIFELFWRPASTMTPFTAILSTIVFVCLLLIAIGYILEHPAMLAESAFMSDGTMVASVPVLIAITFVILDWIGSYIIPSFIFNWTLPLSWICLSLLGLAFVALAVFARQTRLIGILLVASVLGFFVMPYLPFKLVAFLITCAYSAILSTSIYCLELISVPDNIRNSSWTYELACFAILIIDFSTGHYATLSGAQWTRFSGILAIDGIACVFFLIGLVPAIKTHLRERQNAPPAKDFDSSEAN